MNINESWGKAGEEATLVSALNKKSKSDYFFMFILLDKKVLGLQKPNIKIPYHRKFE